MMPAVKYEQFDPKLIFSYNKFMKQDLIDLINNSDMEENDKTEWESIILSLPERVANDMLEAVKDRPQDLNIFNEFYQRKKEAFSVLKADREKGREMLDKIYEEEAQELKNLAMQS
jgi:hypothetical protein